jgi:hypothetical protein
MRQVNKEQVKVNESFTIENFVDCVNEVLLQVTDDQDMYDKVQEALMQFITGQCDVDQFAFEFAMLVRHRDPKTSPVPEI